jgi:hypothetical protein
VTTTIGIATATTTAATTTTEIVVAGCGAMKAPFPRKLGPVGLFLTAYDIWRRIPPQHRRLIVAETRRRAPEVARAVRQRATRKPPR